MGEDSVEDATIAVLVACHNRCQTTLAALERLLAQDVSGYRLSVFLVDDCSTDGTGPSVRSHFPQVHVITTDRPAYWARSMSIAEAAALALDPDLFLWFNDDTLLHEGALKGMLDCLHLVGEAIVVGGTCDPSTGAVSYGGRKLVGSHPQRFELEIPGEEPRQVDAFNGNVVLIPRLVHSTVGPIDGEFAHAYADDDYSLRARALGIPVFLCPGYVGTCARSIEDRKPADLGDFWAWASHPKRRPLRSQYRYLRRHGNRTWPVLLAAGYGRALGSALLRSLRPHRSGQGDGLTQ